MFVQFLLSQALATTGCGYLPDYEQQRLHLLHKYGIDLGDSLGVADGKKTKRMNRKDVEMLMGGGDGQDGVFTWREKNSRKVKFHTHLLPSVSPDRVPYCLQLAYSV